LPVGYPQDSEFKTGYGYPKTAFKRGPDADLDIQKDFTHISRVQTGDVNRVAAALRAVRFLKILLRSLPAALRDFQKC